jgi:hypothetical protein
VSDDPHVCLTTGQIDILITLRYDRTTKSVAGFLGMVDAGQYDGGRLLASDQC